MRAEDLGDSAMTELPVLEPIRGDAKIGSGITSSRHPRLCERGDLQLMGRRPRALVGEEPDGVGDLARIGQCLAGAAGTYGSAQRLYSSIHDQQRDVDALAAKL
jgi:hypothetical protein